MNVTRATILSLALVIAVAAIGVTLWSLGNASPASAQATDGTQATDEATPAPTATPVPNQTLALSVSIYGPDDTEPAGRPDFNAQPGTGSTTRSGGSVSDADVDKPVALAYLTWPAPELQHGTVTGYRIERSFRPMKSPPDMDTWEDDQPDMMVLKHESEGYTATTYEDWDLTVGENYVWQVSAYMDDDDIIEYSPSTDTPWSLDWVYGYNTASGVYLSWVEHPLTISGINVKRTDLSVTPRPTPTVVWTKSANDARSDTDTGTTSGTFYEYEVEYLKPDATAYDTEDDDTTVVLKGGTKLKPSEPLDLDVDWDSRKDTYDITWESGVTNHSQVAYYLVERSSDDGVTWADVGTTRYLGITDWHADAEDYTYRVTPVTFDGRAINPSTATSQVEVQCTLDGNDIAVHGFWLWHESLSVVGRLQPPVDTRSNRALSPEIDSITAVMIGPSETTEQVCDSINRADYILERRVSYAHQIDTVCGEPDANNMRESCDVVGGRSGVDATDWVEVPIDATIDWKTYHANKVVTGLGYHGNLSALPSGMFQLEYQICTDGYPQHCSKVLTSLWQMLDVTAIPFQMEYPHYSNYHEGALIVYD